MNNPKASCGELEVAQAFQPVLKGEKFCTK